MISLLFLVQRKDQKLKKEVCKRIHSFNTLLIFCFLFIIITTNNFWISEFILKLNLFECLSEKEKKNRFRKINAFNHHSFAKFHFQTSWKR